MTFRKAVERTPAIAAHFKPGLQALRGEHHSLVRSSEPRHIDGSVDLDKALRQLRPRDPRWDYGVGCWRTEAIWIEVHPASSSHVDDVLKKLRWLRSWLENEAPALWQLKARFIWLATGSVALPVNSPKRRVLAAAGLVLKSSPLELHRLEW